MKKLLGVALMLALCASSAFAMSPQRTSGLRFGTWTPTGFEASGDTTFLNGAGVNTAALSNVDTTEAFNASWMDWGVNTTDANGSLPVLKFWVSGDFISCDSLFVQPQQSFDKITWFGATIASAQTAGNVVQGVQTAFGVPFVGVNTSGINTTGPSGVNILAIPYIRFIVAADGNTAARMAATKAFVTYGDIRDNPNPRPQLVVRRIKFGTHTPQGFVAEKDTSSVSFTTVDTTETFDLQQWAQGAANMSPLAADSTTAYGVLGGAFTYHASQDSVYLQQQVGPDGIRFSRPRVSPDGLHGNFTGLVLSTTTTDNAATQYGGFLAGIGMAQPSNGARVNSLNYAPFARWTIRSGQAENAYFGTMRAWISYWRIPRN